MPVTLTEKLDSRRYSKGDNPSLEMIYILTGTSDEQTAMMLVENSTATLWNGLSRQSIDIEPDWVDSTHSTGQWTATIRYGLAPPPPETGESTFSFDTSGGSQHITQSIHTVMIYGGVTNAPDFYGAIGVTHDSVEGVDITVPVYSFSETHYLADSAVTDAYKGTLFRLTGKVNTASFRGLAAGECLFLGASGSKRGAEDWEISFKFAGSPNKTGITVGTITGIAKKGWEYMWVRYADDVDATSKSIVKRPVGVYIEQVYENGDFSQLGIGA